MNRIHSSADTTWNMESMTASHHVSTSSLFTQHQLHKSEDGIRLRPFSVEGWIPVILALCFVLIALTRLLFPQRLKQVMLAPFTRRHMHILIRSGNPFKDRITLFLGLIYFLCLPMILLKISRFMNPKMLIINEPIHLYIIIIAFLALYWLVKIALVQILEVVFITRETTREYLTNMLVFNLFIGIFLLPLLFLDTYLNGSIFLWSSIAFITISYLFMFVRGFFIGLSLKRFSYLYLFIYLCTLEIMPLIILLKLLMKIS
jgi:hypothetical protein